MKKFLVFILPFLLISNVYAANEINVDSYSQANNFNYSSRYDYSTDNYLGDSTNFSVGILGERFSGKSYYFQFNFHHTITAGKTYDINFSGDSYDFTNQIKSDRVVPLCYSSFSSSFNTKECENIGIISVKRGSTSGGNSKEFTIRFATTQNYTYWGFKIAGGLYNLTSINNFKISNIRLIEVDTSGSNDIINNANQNTQEIIDNQNSNTNSLIFNDDKNTTNIINNQNENTQSVIDNQKELLGSCYKNLYNKNDIVGGHWITSDNYINSDITWSYCNYIPIEPNTTYTSLYYGESGSAASIVFYDSNYNYISGITHNNRNVITWTSPPNAKYVRDSVPLVSIDGFMILKGSLLSFPYISYNQEKCSSKLDETTNAINETNNYLMDDSNPNLSNNEFTSLFSSIGFNDPLSNLLLLPVQFINQLVSQSNTCQTINLGSLWGVSISLPCINVGSIIGSSVWNTIDILSSIGLIVAIFKHIYETIANALTLGGFKEAKSSFSMPTPMDFLVMILGGDR